MRDVSIFGVSRMLGGLVLAAALPWYASAHAQPTLAPPDSLTPPGALTPADALPPVDTLTSPSIPATPVPAITSPINPPAKIPNLEPSVQPGETILVITAPVTKLPLRAQETRVLELGNRIRIVDGFDQTKINVTALSPTRIRVRGEQPGVTSVKLIDEFDNVHNVEIFIEPDTRELKAYLDRLFPDTSIDVVGIRDGVVLRGWVTQPSQIPQIISVAEQFYPIVQPQLTVAAPNLVQLHVKVIEVNRTKLKELGFNFFMAGKRYFIHNGTGGLAPIGGIGFPGGNGPFDGLPPLGKATSNWQFAIAGNNTFFQGFLHALQEEHLAKILAEPVLTTTSGRPAVLRAGGEFPVPNSQGFGGQGVDFKPIGVTLEAVPVVLGNGRLRLDLAPEYSEKDVANATVIAGNVVMGVATRGVNTQVEMGFGETLMIGGLISTRRTGSTSKVPFLGELPWIGAAFSWKSYEMGETELIILVTPQMAGPMAPHQVPTNGPGMNSTDPTTRELYFDGNLELPNFGPECPGGNCPPEGGMMSPVDMTPLNEPVPVPAVTSRSPSARKRMSGDIQQTSAEQVVPAANEKRMINNPFQRPLESTEFKPARENAVPQRQFPAVSETHSMSTKGKNRLGSSELPGMIEPKSTANQPASLAN